MALKEFCVMFEFIDIHCNDDTFCKEIIEKCGMLCEIFGFECSHIKLMEIVGLPHLRFNLSFISNFLGFDYKMNVIKAFAQEYQLTLTSVKSNDIATFL